MAVLDELREAVIDGQAKLAVAKATQGLEQGIPAEILLQDGLIAAMREVGRLFEEGEIYVPEMLVAARAMKATVAVLKPRLIEHSVQSSGTVAIGTVQGDLHDIGKNLVAMMLEGSGFEVVDLGTDVPPERFIDAIRAGADVVGMSALLTTTMPYMKVVIDTMKEKGIRSEYIVLVGGAPLNETFADAVGADAYCRDAAVTVETAKALLARRQGSAQARELV